MALFSAFTLAVASLAATAYGAYQQHEAAGDASDAAAQAAQAQTTAAGAQRERAALEARRADIANARQLRGAIRQARIVKGTLGNQAANAGTSYSSGAIGGAGSVESQGRSNIGFFNQMDDINDQVLVTQNTESAARTASGVAQGEVSVAEANGRQWGAFSNLGGTVFTGAGGFKTIFDGPTKAS